MLTGNVYIMAQQHYTAIAMLRLEYTWTFMPDVYSNRKRDNRGCDAAMEFPSRLHRKVKVHVYSKRSIVIAV